MAAGLDSLKFSLNFTDAEQLSSVAQVSPAYFAKAIGSVKEARRIRDEGGYQCGLYASSIAFDGEQGERMRALLPKLSPS